MCMIVDGTLNELFCCMCVCICVFFLIQVKKSEAQFESYVSELKSLQGANFDVAHSAKVELTQLRNEVTALKLELNLRTNELRELQLDANSTQQQLQRERQRGEEMRKDKDSRITSLLAQLQQFSLDYSHEKGERLRLERENERLWNDRMAYRAEQIRSSQLNGAERALALERDALEKREWLEWKKKAALRDIQSKERLRHDAWEMRQSIEADAHKQMEQLRSELTGAQAAEERERNTASVRFQEQQELQRVRERENRDRAERERQYLSELETTTSGNSSSVNTQRWEHRKNQLRDEAEIDRMIAQLQAGSAQLTQKALSQLETGDRPLPASDVVRSGNYIGGVESVINAPRTTPSIPLFSSQTAVPSLGYHPTSVASSISPPSNIQQQTVPSGGSGITEADRAAIRKEMEELLQQQLKAQPQPQPAVKAETKRTDTLRPTTDTGRSSHHHRPRSTGSRNNGSDTASSVDMEDVESSLRHSRKVRGENNRVAAAASAVGSKSSAPKSSRSVHVDDVTSEEERKYSNPSRSHDNDDSSDNESASVNPKSVRPSSARVSRTNDGTSPSEDETSSVRERKDKISGKKITIDGREIVPVRNFTLYAVSKSTTDSS
jgi:hypothetical protein